MIWTPGQSRERGCAELGLCDTRRGGRPGGSAWRTRGEISTYSFFDRTEFFKLLAESSLLGVPGKAAGRAEG